MMSSLFSTSLPLSFFLSSVYFPDAAAMLGCVNKGCSLPEVWFTAEVCVPCAGVEPRVAADVQVWLQTCTTSRRVVASLIPQR